MVAKIIVLVLQARRDAEKPTSKGAYEKSDLIWIGLFGVGAYLIITA